MPKYYILADGKNCTKDQLLNMFANKEYPETITIGGIVSEENRESERWEFESHHGSYSSMRYQIYFPDNEDVPVRRYYENRDMPETIEDIIENVFGPEAIAVNAPRPGPQPGGRRRSQRKRTQRRRATRRSSSRRRANRRS
jgi:hypothetical protein